MTAPQVIAASSAPPSSRGTARGGGSGTEEASLAKNTRSIVVDGRAAVAMIDGTHLCLLPLKAAGGVERPTTTGSDGTPTTTGVDDGGHELDSGVGDGYGVGRGDAVRSRVRMKVPAVPIHRIPDLLLPMSSSKCDDVDGDGAEDGSMGYGNDDDLSEDGSSLDDVRDCVEVIDVEMDRGGLVDHHHGRSDENGATAADALGGAVMVIDTGSSVIEFARTLLIPHPPPTTTRVVGNDVRSGDDDTTTNSLSAAGGGRRVVVRALVDDGGDGILIHRRRRRRREEEARDGLNERKRRKRGKRSFGGPGSGGGEGRRVEHHQREGPKQPPPPPSRNLLPPPLVLSWPRISDCSSLPGPSRARTKKIDTEAEGVGSFLVADFLGNGLEQVLLLPEIPSGVEVGGAMGSPSSDLAEVCGEGGGEGDTAGDRQLLG